MADSTAPRATPGRDEAPTGLAWHVFTATRPGLGRDIPPGHESLMWVANSATLISGDRRRGERVRERGRRAGPRALRLPAHPRDGRAGGQDRSAQPVAPGGSSRSATTP